MYTFDLLNTDRNAQMGCIQCLTRRRHFSFLIVLFRQHLVEGNTENRMVWAGFDQGQLHTALGGASEGQWEVVPPMSAQSQCLKILFKNRDRRLKVKYDKKFHKKTKILISFKSSSVQYERNSCAYKAHPFYTHSILASGAIRSLIVQTLYSQYFGQIYVSAL